MAQRDVETRLGDPAEGVVDLERADLGRILVVKPGVIDPGAEVGAEPALRVEVVLQGQRRRQQLDVTDLDHAVNEGGMLGRRQDEFGGDVVGKEIGEVELRYRVALDHRGRAQRGRSAIVGVHVNGAQADDQIALLFHRQRRVGEGQAETARQ